MVSTSEWSRFQQPGTPGRRTFVAIRTIAWLLPLVFFSSTATAQSPTSQRYWITFRDRGDAARFDVASVNARNLGISERALWRRAKVLPPDRLINELDLPVPQSYIDAIRSAGASIRSTSRWFNAVSAELSPDQRSVAESLPFVASIQRVAVLRKNRPHYSPELAQAPSQKRRLTASLDYGPSLIQLSNIKVVDAHNRGINGSGVIVGMIDDGFNYHNTHPALRNIKVLAEYDFIQRDSSTSRAPGEYASQGGHGAATLSAIAGFDNGKLIGASYGASFILAKTEIDSVEIRLEEDLYVEALEWMERLGADVVSTSLGYIDWYTYSNLDGKTATTSKAAR
ncbi:MAG: S8 family serine peptidase, partial [Bacteroidota bacterium]